MRPSPEPRLALAPDSISTMTSASTRASAIARRDAHLFGVAGAQYDLVHYISDEAACKERLAELGLKPFGAG